MSAIAISQYGPIRTGRARGPAVVRDIVAGAGAGSVIVLSRWRNWAAARAERDARIAHEAQHRVPGPCLVTGGLRDCSARDWTEEEKQCPVCGRWAAGHGEQHGWVEVSNSLGQARLIRDDDEEETR